MKKTIHMATGLALGTALISGTNGFLTKSAVSVVANPIVFTTLKNSIVVLFLVGLIIGFRKWPEIKALTRQQWTKLVAIGVIGGAVPFALFFTGLSKISAINAVMIHKTLFIWVLLLAIPFLKEKLTRPQWIGVGAIFAANLMIGGFKGFSFSIGELMILGATLLWAVENIISKKALKDLSSLTVASARMTIGAVVLFGLVAWQGNLGMLSGLGAEQWAWTFLTSALLLGYVLTWYTALKFAPASYVAALIVPATLVTNVLSAIFVTHAFSGRQFLAAMLYLVGIGLMILYAKRATVLVPANKAETF